MARSMQLTSLEPWHHDFIGWMLQTPAASGRDAAAHFGVTPVWISITVYRQGTDGDRGTAFGALIEDLGRALGGGS